MQLPTSSQQDRVQYKHYFLLLLICLLAYWPLTFGIFSVKNDAIHYFLPYRFNISEALRNGEGPFWSPYIYLGNPVMGDMQSGAWNPIVWLFSLFGRYDLTLFHFENLLYIFLGGVGMYKLTNRLAGHSNTAMLIAVSYMLSGFMLGGQLINWLAAAAFIPFVIHYYLLTLQTGFFKNAIKTAIALYLLFTASYPSFFILTAYLLVLLFIVSLIKRYRDKKETAVKTGRLFLTQGCIAIIFAGLCLPAIISYIDLLPYYQRGAGARYEDTITNAFSFQHLLTFLFPGTIKASDISSATDITCRNVYIGLIPMLLLIALPPKATRRNILLISLAVFALLFSLGDATPVRKICYQFIPLLDTFRHPSQMRLFLILALLLLTAPGIKKILTGTITDAEKKRIRLTVIISAIVVLIITIWALLHSTIFNKLNLAGGGGIRSIIKGFLESVTLNDTLAMNGLLQLSFFAVILLWYKKWLRSASFFIAVSAINLFVMAQLVLPASFVSKVSPKTINSIIHASPTGFPVEGLQASLAANSADAFADYNIIGLHYFYNKKIGISKVTNSPAFLSRLDSFIQTNLPYNMVASLPVAYLATRTVTIKDTASLATIADSCIYAIADLSLQAVPCGLTNRAVIKKLSSNKFEIETESTGDALLVLTQNFYPHWKATVDGSDVQVIKTNMSFMGCRVPAGKHTVVFKFSPANTIVAMWIQLAVLLSLVAGWIYFIIKNKK